MAGMARPRTPAILGEARAMVAATAVAVRRHGRGTMGREVPGGILIRNVAPSFNGAERSCGSC